MDLINTMKCSLSEADGVFTLKNQNTTLGFVRFNNAGEVEYIFVNPLFRKKKIAKKLLKLVREKTQKKLIFQKPISPLGSKLLESIKRWN
jgi:predicted acetyltransferase